MSEPRVVSRKEWGAQQARKPYGKISLPARELWLHHSVTPVTADPFHDARVIQRVAFDRGMIDVAYTTLFHPNGTILEGRPYWALGAHTENHNGWSLGFCLIGNYENQVPTPEQVNSVRWARRHYLGLKALSVGHSFGGHRDTKATACPGRHAYEALYLFRQPYQPPQQGDDDMARIIWANGVDEVYVTDWVTKWHVPNAEVLGELEHYKKLPKEEVSPALLHAIPTAGTG